MSLNIIQREFLRYGKVGDRGSGPLCSIPVPLVPLWGSWSDLEITALKWACFQVVDALTNPPL